LRLDQTPLDEATLSPGRVLLVRDAANTPQPIELAVDSPPHMVEQCGDVAVPER
jgi:hypothetical protein